MQASPACIKLIKRFEGLRLTEYRDAVGYPTIGYGHKILKTETFGAITEAQALSLLEADIARKEKDLQEVVAGCLLTQGQYDALVSFAYNVGVQSLAGSTLLRLLEAGDNLGAAGEFLKWTHAGGLVEPGLVARREAERKLFLG